MTSLDKSLRNQLERTVKDARDAAEAAARAAIDHLGVGDASAPAYLSAEERELRRRLRIHSHQLGDQRESKSTNPAVGKQETDRLVEEVAYGHWHRMLFARFLAENDLLMYPDPAEPVAVSIQECDDLAADEGARNGWELAARFAANMLPEIFRTDSPVFEVDLPPEGQQQLERTLAELPAEVFQASDSLGWVYQFWQAKRKDEVNASEVKIGARELPAVTQLFTEDYMVSFLLDNTLGAWWAGKKVNTEDTENTETEGELRKKVALPGVNWDYLRFVRDDVASDSVSNPKSEISNPKSPWRPAAGTFPGWPKTAAEITVLDPCMGSGHFLVFALPILAALRTAEEGLTPREAVDAVLRDNLFGLEIDPRCAQIAAFNLALAAWRMTGFHPLPSLNLACTGIGPQATEDEWVALAEQSGEPITVLSRQPIENGLRNLHALFSDAPTLGSLIDPNQLPSDMFAADYETLLPYLSAALTAEQPDDVRERAVAAAGMVKAAELLAGEYTLVITNVPYLGYKRQKEPLRTYCDKHYPVAKPDLATCFVERSLQFCGVGAVIALVTPQNWLFLGAYEQFRQGLLGQSTWNLVARLGPRAFDTITGEIVSVTLVAITNSPACADTKIAGIDVTNDKSPAPKAESLSGKSMGLVDQRIQLKNPDARIGFQEASSLPLLSEFAISMRGIVTGDGDKWYRGMWEVADFADRWKYLQNSVGEVVPYGGRELIVDWRTGGSGMLRPGTENNAYGKSGVSIRHTGNLAATLYGGELYDQTSAVIVPNDPGLLSAIWSFCTHADFYDAVRELDQALKVTNATLVKVPFDLARWEDIAAEKYPNGLPEPESDDPTQWLFHGRPEESTVPLQVAAARLLGYRWPAELDTEMRLSARARDLVKRCDELLPLADRDGLVCIPAVRGEATAADRLLNLLAQAYGSAWSTDTLNRLLKDAGYAGKTLETWLRDGFFAQHCELFHQRPFIWQIWDGLRDGFSILVNYHRLDRKNLETLLYTYLGDWIVRQKRDETARVDGAQERLAAAVALQKRLELIRDGESPYDIFVRWKPLHLQPIGWEPDLNDGVRLNIRPLLSVPDVKTKGAGVLRAKPKIKWEKDRGKEPQRPRDEFPWFWGWDGSEDFPGGPDFTGERFNDCHYTIRVKTAARERHG
ncbi:MAG: SAM-dependent DNA methyltransferase [Candidatus Anammoximicrobium sp.]|nr:SAM-dependent DNA methyltransferase [Candidatus Anammoximicrobium sp.]